MKDTKWVLIRGLAREARHWGEFLDLMQKTYGAENIITLDLPGVGEAKAEAVPVTIAQSLVQVRNRFLQKHIMPPEEDGPLKVNLVAVSLGGMLALEWLANYPNEVASAHIINSSAGLNYFQRLNWKSYKNIASMLMTKDCLLREEKSLQIVCNNRKQDEVVLKLWQKLAIESPISPQVAIKQILAGACFQGPNPDLVDNKKLYFYASLKDRFVSANCSKLLAKKYSAPLLIHPWAGHDLTTDDPKWMLEKFQELENLIVTT